MSVSKIKKCLDKIKEEDIDSFWLEQVVVDLLFAVAEHLVENPSKAVSKNDDTSGVPQGWIRLNDFIKNERIFSVSTVSSSMSRDLDFRRRCTFKLGGKVFVDPEATKEYLLNKPRLKKTLARFNHAC